MDKTHNRLSTVITTLIIASVSLLAVACSPIVATKGAVSSDSAVIGKSSSSLSDNSASNTGSVESTSSMEPSSSGTVIVNDIKATDDLIKVSVSSANSSSNEASASNNSLHEASLMWPLIKDAPIGSGFEQYEGHTGIDFIVPKDTEIIAVDDGIVTEAKEAVGGYGKYIVIDHGNGVQTLYAHCESLDIEVGSTVKRGDVIASSGDSGNTTGYQLHFELRVDGKCIDPEPYLIPAKK